MLKRQTGIDMTHVPYSGAAPAMNAALAGDVTMFCAPIPLGMWRNDRYGRLEPSTDARHMAAFGQTGH